MVVEGSMNLVFFLQPEINAKIGLRTKILDFYSFLTKWQKNLAKMLKKAMFNLHSTPPQTQTLEILVHQITIIRDLWKITQIGSIGLGTYLFSTNTNFI